MEDIVIVGGGPAGLTAAIYVQRAGKHAVVYEGNVCGGQIINASKVENYPSISEISGADFALNLYNQAVKLGAEVRFEKVVGISVEKDFKTVKTTNGSVQTKAVILATGAFNRKLGIEGENLFLGRGISYCATCDGAFYKNKNVAVVGGGNTALDDALYLSNICNKVYLIHRRDEFRGSQETVSLLKGKSNVEFILNSNVTKLIGQNKLEQVEITHNDSSKSILDVSGLFVAVGQVPGNGAFENVIKLDGYGYIIAGEDCKTNVEGVFVAGDARIKQVRQLTTACSDGTIAGISAVNYIRGIK